MCQKPAPPVVAPNPPVVAPCTTCARLRFSLFDHNTSFVASLKYNMGSLIGFNMDTALLDAFKAARFDDYSLVQTITFDAAGKPPKWSFGPSGQFSEKMRVDYLQRIASEMHARGAQVFVGYNLVDDGDASSDAGKKFLSWLVSASDADLKQHGTEIAGFFTQRNISIDGVGFDIELNGFGPSHGTAFTKLLNATAAASGIVYYDNGPFQPNDGEGSTAIMAPLKYALAAPTNIIARPMCYTRTTVTPRSTIEASLKCALRPTSSGGGGLPASHLQMAIDTRTGDGEMSSMCSSLLRPNGVGMTVNLMPNDAASKRPFLGRMVAIEAALNPGAPAPKWP